MTTGFLNDLLDWRPRRNGHASSGREADPLTGLEGQGAFPGEPPFSSTGLSVDALGTKGFPRPAAFSNAAFPGSDLLTGGLQLAGMPPGEVPQVPISVPGPSGLSGKPQGSAFTEQVSILKRGGRWAPEPDTTTESPDDASGTLPTYSDLGITFKRGKWRTTAENILPWGVQAVWQNPGGPADDFSDVYAFVLDTGFDSLFAADFNLATEWAADFTGKGSWEDGHGHGSHVSGTLAAKATTPQDWDFSVTGVAPGANLIPVKVLDDRGSGSYGWVYEGLSHALNLIINTVEGDPINPGNSVINMSLGGPLDNGYFSDLFSLADQHDVKIVVAAGNSTADADGFSPASYGDGDDVTGVTALDKNYAFASFSNFDQVAEGAEDDTDWAMPGVDVWSYDINGGTSNLGMSKKSGTSMAAPHAAGALLAELKGYSLATFDGVIVDPAIADPFAYILMA